MITAQLKHVIAVVLMAGCVGPEHVSFPTPGGGVVHGDMYRTGDQGDRLMRKILDFLSD